MTVTPRLLFRRLALKIGLPLAFFATAAVPISLFGVNSPLWYANALALAALLLRPTGSWSALLALIWVADTAAVFTFGSGPAPLIATCDVLEIAAAASLIRWSGGLPPPLFSGTQMARFAAICLAVPTLSSALGAGLVATSDGVPFLREWVTWYISSALGLLLITPFLLAWTDGKVRSRELQHATWLRQFAATAAIVLGVAAIFAVPHPAALFVSFPLMLLVTWHLGLLGATSAAVVVAVVATTATVLGSGPIAHMAPEGTSTVGHVQNMQFYLTCLLFTSLPLATLFSHLRATAQSRTDFLAAMSHEIRTPMTGVLGMADLLHQEDLPAHVRPFVDSLRASGRHLLHVVNDILDYSRLQSGHVQLEDVAFPMADVVEQVRSITSPLALERHLALSFTIDEGVPRCVRGDPARLRQVLLNLVGNAIKFTEAGSVSVDISPVGGVDDDGSGRVRFEVRDTGIGIPPEHQEEIFGAFAQADNSTSRKYGGSGLGLAISQEIVRAMGGAIAVRSEPGIGSAFAFDIPLLRVEASAQRATAARTIGKPSAPLAILVVDDVEVNRQLLGHVLSRAGHAVSFAFDGQQAVDQVREGRFDVVLMDVQMPVMDGVEATRRIRRLGAGHATVPILGLTANVMAHERESYLAAGMDACLTKPIAWPELWAALSSHGRVPAPALIDAAGSDDAALVDMAVVENLRKLAPSDALAGMLASSLKTAEQCCAVLAGVDAHGSFVAQAHKLKGTAGTFGMPKLSALAARIETSARTGDPLGALVLELQAALIDTRSELERLGLVTRAKVSTQ